MSARFPKRRKCTCCERRGARWRAGEDLRRLRQGASRLRCLGAVVGGRADRAVAGLGLWGSLQSFPEKKSHRPRARSIRVLRNRDAQSGGDASSSRLASLGDGRGRLPYLREDRGWR